MEESFTAKFRQDLSHVTVHRDAAASRAVRGVGASAFARGSDIFFAEGAFQPGTASGQALLAHELAHVVQQTGTRSHSSLGQPSTSEEYARRASRDQHAGADFLDAGPAAPLSLASDIGVAIEDEAAQQSVLLSDDELAERALDLQAAADKRREAVGGTDIATGKLDQQLWQTVDVARASVAGKQKAKAKEKKNKSRNKKNKNENDPALSGPNSSRDLSNATDGQVDDHLHQLRKAEILNPDPKGRERLRREIENVQGEKDTRAAAAAAERKAQAEALTHQVKDFRDRIKSLEEHAVAVNDLRRSTSSIITGPTHFWGGAWTEVEPGDFASANVYLNQAADAVNEGNLQYAQYLLGQSASEYYDLMSRFGRYMDGIERGANRSVAVLKVVKTAGRVAGSELDPTGGFLYGSAQDLAGQVSEVAYGQRESIDYKGIVVDNAINTVVSGVAGYGSSVVGKAASPYLSQLGRFSGLARSGLQYATSTAISSGLTGTSFGDNLTDPNNLFAHAFGEGIAASNAQTKGPGAKPPSTPPSETVLPRSAPPALAGGAAIPAPAAPASPIVHALPEPALPGTPTAATPASPSAGAGPVTHAPEPPSTPTHAPEHFTGPKPNSIQGGGQGSGKPQGLLFGADKPPGRHIEVDASHPLLANKTAANDNLDNVAQAARQFLQPTGTGDVAPARVVGDTEPVPASNLSGANGIRAGAGDPPRGPSNAPENPQVAQHAAEPDAAPAQSSGPPRAKKPWRPRARKRPTYYGGGGDGSAKGTHWLPPAPPVEYVRPGSPRAERPQLNAADQERAQQARDVADRLGRPLALKVKAAAPQGDVVRSGFGEHAGGGGAATTAQVLATGAQIQHVFVENESLDNGIPGREKASHAEKQAAMEHPDQPLAVDQAMCADCFGFFGRLAVGRGTPQVVHEPGVTWVFQPDGTAVGISSGAQVVIHPDGSAITDPIPPPTAP